ncbi:hypothetical protein ACXR0O_09510 [Verrucomicrobiota bacterium sgz303538]
MTRRVPDMTRRLADMTSRVPDMTRRLSDMTSRVPDMTRHLVGVMRDFYETKSGLIV